MKNESSAVLDEGVRRQKILKKRAELLAKSPVEPEINSNIIEILTFKLNCEQYGIESAYIKEVYRFRDYTPLPCTPPFVYGLVNVRRRIISIIDLKVFFGMPSDEGLERKAIILSHGDMEFGLLCYGQPEIKKIHSDKLQSALPTMTGIRQEFLQGMTADGIVILDGKKLLASKHMVVNEANL